MSRMAGSVFMAVALFALPSVLAISCYTCTPRGQMEPCTNPQNVINCDDVAPQGVTYDACVNVSFQYAVGETLGQKQCGVKAECAKLKEEICNITKIELETGMRLQGCLMSCCQDDQCNGGIVRAGGPVDSSSGIVISESSIVTESSIATGSLVQILNDLCTFPGAECVAGAPQDACVVASFEMSAGRTRMRRSAMRCGIKPNCAKLKPMFCKGLENATEQGATLNNCDFNCCQEDECDLHKCSTPSRGLSLNASTFVIVKCILVMFSGRFFH